MDIKPQYQDQVKLLLDVLPFVARETCFALKGGTAINLFEWDLPRLSVDIDLSYLPMQGRQDAVVSISQDRGFLEWIYVEFAHTVRKPSFDCRL